MARTGRPAKPIELAGSARAEADAGVAAVGARRWCTRSRLPTAGTGARTAPRPVDLELFANRSWRYVHSDTGATGCERTAPTG